MKNLALISLAVVSASAFAAKPHVYKGWVGDEKCGVKCASVGHMACAQSCLKRGGTYVFVFDNKDHKIYKIENPDAVKGHEGHLVQVTATISGDKIHVDALKMLKQPAPPEKTQHDMNH
ncbi:MAG TPA: hypothetical protein VKT78_03160 [Fimbriimonadaceae bacterium]|nr:hypothetical protein [Fimbriimonadaceae bacterium]